MNMRTKRRNELHFCRLSNIIYRICEQSPDIHEYHNQQPSYVNILVLFHQVVISITYYFISFFVSIPFIIAIVLCLVYFFFSPGGLPDLVVTYLAGQRMGGKCYQPSLVLVRGSLGW